MWFDALRAEYAVLHCAVLVVDARRQHATIAVALGAAAGFVFL